MTAGPEAPLLVLVVDDVEDERDVWVRLLRGQGWRAEPARSGRECLEAASRLAPAVILLDFSLPDLDGWEVTRRLKASARTSSIPVIALTGHDTGEARDRALRAGVSGYLVKPCAPEDVLEELRRHAPPPARD
jgi:two-component system, cell cycle response regulator DivK